MSTQNHSHNRRSFLRMVALGAGAAALAACGAPAANTGLSDEERAALEAKGDEIAAAIAADTTPKVKIKGAMACSGNKTGTVSYYNRSKGLGFIVDKDGGPNIWVQRADVNGAELEEGREVSFSVSKGRLGLIAVNVCMI